VHYYPHHIGDFLKDAGHLTNEQLGIYLKMIWRYYLQEGPLPDDCESIAFAVGSDEKTVRLLLKHYFVLTDEGWRQLRCDKVIIEGNADESKNDANQKPITNNQRNTPSRKREVVKPSDVSDAVWQDFISQRKAIKAPLTETALQSIMREAGKAGWTLQDALQESITRGWRSFKAEWVTAKSQSTNFFGGI
jgi:uncharacterized protein YdaU (DUF1376 family)